MTDGNCIISIQNGTTDSVGYTVINTTLGGAPTLKCTCLGPESAGLLTANVHVTSNNCPIKTGGLQETVTCNN